MHIHVTTDLWMWACLASGVGREVYWMGVVGVSVDGKRLLTGHPHLKNIIDHLQLVLHRSLESRTMLPANLSQPSPCRPTICYIVTHVVTLPMSPIVSELLQLQYLAFTRKQHQLQLKPFVLSEQIASAKSFLESRESPHIHCRC